MTDNNCTFHVSGIPETWKLVSEMEITPKRASAETGVRQTMQFRHRPFLIEGSGPTVLKVRGQGGMWPVHRDIPNGDPLPTSFVSKDELKAIIQPEAIAKAGTFIVTLKREGEALLESYHAHLVVGFRP